MSELECLLNSELIDMWKVLSGEENMLKKVFAQLLEVLTLSLPYQEKNKGNKIVRLHTETPQSVNLAGSKFALLLLLCSIFRPPKPLLFCVALKKLAL